jgi:hypothetical protein
VAALFCARVLRVQPDGGVVLVVAGAVLIVASVGRTWSAGPVSIEHPRDIATVSSLSTQVMRRIGPGPYVVRGCCVSTFLTTRFGVLQALRNHGIDAGVDPSERYLGAAHPVDARTAPVLEVVDLGEYDPPHGAIRLAFHRAPPDVVPAHVARLRRDVAASRRTAQLVLTRTGRAVVVGPDKRAARALLRLLEHAPPPNRLLDDARFLALANAGYVTIRRLDPQDAFTLNDVVDAAAGKGQRFAVYLIAPPAR